MKIKQKYLPLLIAAGVLVLAALVGRQVVSGLFVDKFVASSSDSLFENDVFYKWSNVGDVRDIHFSDEWLPIVGESSEEDVYDHFGTDVTSRWTYLEPRQKTIGDQTFQYDKVLNFDDVIYQTSKKTNGTIRSVSQTPTDYYTAIAFLDKGVLSHLMYRHQVRNKSDDLEVVKIVGWEEFKWGHWPDHSKDKRDYYDQREPAFQKKHAQEMQSARELEEMFFKYN